MVVLTDLQRRILTDVLVVGSAYPFVLTGDCAAQAHGLVEYLS